MKEEMIKKLKEEIKTEKHFYYKRCMFFLILVLEEFDSIYNVKEAETRSGWDYKKDFIHSAKNPNLSIYGKKGKANVNLSYSVQLFSSKTIHLWMSGISKDIKFELEKLTPLVHGSAKGLSEDVILSLKKEIKEAMLKAEKEAENLEQNKKNTFKKIVESNSVIENFINN